MLSLVRRHGRIVVSTTSFSWGNDLERIFDLLSHRFDGFNDNGFYAHPEEHAIRMELMEIPSLRAFATQLRDTAAKGTVLYNLGLAGLSEERRNAALYAITLMLGYPTSTDQRTGRVAWDVKARPLAGENAGFVTFSERTGSADMHTDSSFYPMPEEQFILYVVTAARCGGGNTLLIDAEDVYSALQASAQGRAAYTLLQQTLVPFRVPSIYAAGEEKIEYESALVFGPATRQGERFTLRWRYDAIMKGLAACPHMSSPALLEALALMHQVAEKDALRFDEQLPDDTLMLADNHHILHGRTYYADERRHLIRIRMSDVPNSERIGPSGIVRD